MTAVLEPRATSDLDDIDMLCAADYPSRSVQWLWRGRIPIGKVTLLVGDPGQGKSLVALDIAARVSSGAPWPDERVESPETRAKDQPFQLSTLDSPLSTPPGSVIILSAQDDLRDTIRPRLDAAGADPSRIFLLPSIVDLRNDLDKLRTAIERVPDCRLIIIDPVNAYVGPGDSHFHTIVRRVFQPLAQLAADKGIAILGISHLRKNEGAAIQRAAGSMGFVAAARAVWTVCPDPVQLDRHLLLPLKNNFAVDTTGLAYTIAKPSLPPLSDSPLGTVYYDAPAIAWQTNAVITTATEALAPVRRSSGPEPAELNAAAEWLRGELVDGPREADSILFEAGLAGFHERTLRRALYALGGRTIKRSWQEGWCWSLAGDDCGPHSPADPSENLSPSEGTCPLRENPDAFAEQTWPLRENLAEFEPEMGPLRDAWLVREPKSLLLPQTHEDSPPSSSDIRSDSRQPPRQSPPARQPDPDIHRCVERFVMHRVQQLSKRRGKRRRNRLSLRKLLEPDHLRDPRDSS